MIDAAISESVFNMLEGCIPEYVAHGHDRPPSGSTISGATSIPHSHAVSQLHMAIVSWSYKDESLSMRSSQHKYPFHPKFEVIRQEHSAAQQC